MLTVVCALPLVWAAVRYRSKLTVWIDRLPYLLHAVPGLVIALSLIYFTINYANSLYQNFFSYHVASLCSIYQWHKPHLEPHLNNFLIILRK